MYRREAVEHQDAQLAGGWDLGVWTPPILRIYLSLNRSVAVVVTVAGFVVRGFDLRGTVPDPGEPGCRRLLLDEPGPWFAELRETRLDLGRGHPWRLVQKRVGP